MSYMTFMISVSWVGQITSSCDKEKRLLKANIVRRWSIPSSTLAFELFLFSDALFCFVYFADHKGRNCILHINVECMCWNFFFLVQSAVREFRSPLLEFSSHAPMSSASCPPVLEKIFKQERYELDLVVWLFWMHCGLCYVLGNNILLI